MRRITLLALLPTVLTLATAAGAGAAPAERHEDASSSTSEYRAGEDWNDFAVRQGWWGRGRSDKVAPAPVSPGGEPARGGDGRSIASPQGLSDAEKGQ
jgi:hypothetical protein